MGILKVKKSEADIIPSVKYGNMLLTKNFDQSTFSEYENIAKNLAFGINIKTCKTIMITSAMHGSGKSVMATNLAVVFAKSNYKVLLVDNEFTLPVLHTYFDIGGTAGLSDYISNDKTDAILQTSVENVDLAPVFSSADQTGRIITAEEYKNFINTQNDKYDWIIINAPAAQSSNDALMINALCDGSLLAIDLGKSRLYSVKALKKQLGEKLIGAVLLDNTEQKEQA